MGLCISNACLKALLLAGSEKGGYILIWVFS